MFILFSFIYSIFQFFSLFIHLFIYLFIQLIIFFYSKKFFFNFIFEQDYFLKSNSFFLSNYSS